MWMEKICGDQKYKRWFPKEVFTGDKAGSQSVGWVKDVFKDADKTDEMVSAAVTPILTLILTYFIVRRSPAWVNIELH